MSGRPTEPARPASMNLLVAMGLGSNLPPAKVSPFAEAAAADPRLRALVGGLRLLAAAGVSVVAASTVRETEPVGVDPAQPPFLNAVVLVASGLDLPSLLATCEDIERRAGRAGKGDGRARPLDLDLLAAWCRREGGLTAIVRPGPSPPVLPHPRLLARAFALQPLAELLPEAPLPAGPGAAARSAREHLAALGPARGAAGREVGALLPWPG